MLDVTPQQYGRARIVIVTCIVVITLCSATSVAGGQSEARIMGQVTLYIGAVLPGVTVTVSGPALQVGQLTSVTNEVGEYRLTPLPIGTYELTFTLQGIQSVKRDAIRLVAGFVARIDATMSLGNVSETITVSGAAPSST